MGILLVRHAEAIEGGGEIDDSARWLTEKGRERARKVARALREKGVDIERFVASPRVRAVQTAELFATELGYEGVIEIIPALSFTVPAVKARDALAKLSGVTAAFGHMPTIGELLNLLAPKANPNFSPAEAVLIDKGDVKFRLAP
jgi:phosphohistidine phosphatase SixA